MQFHQQFEDGLGSGGRVVDGRQALAQLGQQFGQQARQLACVRAGQGGLRAPDQGVHQLLVAAWVGAAGGVGQARLCHDLGPGAEQKTGNLVGHLAEIRPQREVARNPGGQQVALFSVLQGLDGALAFLFALLVLFCPFGVQLLEHVLEIVGPVDGGGGQRARDVHERAHEALEAGSFGAVEGQAAVGDVLQQSARGVLLVAEETGVGYGQLYQGRLQRADELLHRPQQPTIARDVVHHQRHHLHAQGLSQSAGMFARRGCRAALCAAADLLRALAPQSLHHVADLVHGLQRFEGGGHGGCEVRGGWVDGGKLVGVIELACELVREALV